MDALLDRDVELAELGRRLAGARAGAGRVIVVEGPAGIGKSTLLAALGQSASLDGATSLRARCSPLEQHAAWGMARQLFEPLRTRPDWADLTVGAAGLAERVLAAETEQPVLAGDAMHAAVRGLVWLASNLGERGATVLVVDDVHWADAPSLRWLALLARSLAELRIAVICAVRSGEPAASPELLADLLASAPEPPVRPRPLGPAATQTLVRERLPAASEGFAQACHAVSGGNPFLLGALLTQLTADAVAPDDEAAARLGTFGSEQVARVVERQLARLPDGAASLARAVAVLGSGTALRHAARLAGITIAEAARAADALRAAGLAEAETETGLTLAHPLIAGTLYTSLPPGERALRHGDAAALLASERADPERVALHLLRTEPAGETATVTALREAAAQASSRGAPQSAAAYLRRAAAEPPPDAAQDADVRLELGLALAAYMQPDAFGLLQEAVAVAATPVQRGVIALSGARALGLSGRFDPSVALCRQALEHAEAYPPELSERLEAELACNGWVQAATVDLARRYARERPGGAGLGLWRVSGAVEAMFENRSAAETLAVLRPLLDGGGLAAEPGSLLWTVSTLTLIAEDELAAGIAQCEGLIDVARPRGWLMALTHGCMFRAMALVRAGEVRDAEADARLAFEYKLPVSPAPAMLWCLSFLVDALVEVDDLAGADTVLTEARQQGAPPDGALPALLLLQGRARLRLAQHRPEDALADARLAAVRAAELGVCHPVFAGWRAEAVEALAVLGDLTQARRLASEQAALSERLGTPGARGAAMRLLARTEADPIPLLEQAVRTLACSPARLEHTRALLALGAALRRANRRADARAPLRRALEQADRGGMQLLAGRARAELNAIGARPRRSAVSGPGALTPAEHRVAQLAARGHGNRAIAERLYVTQRTVETHLTHAFQKLDIRSRAELAAALGEREPAGAATPAAAG